LLRKALGRARSNWVRYWESRRLSPLYSPDPASLDPQAHLDAALDWLKRAQDAGADRGVSYGVRFGDDFDVSYPETTGYICQTFVEMHELTGERDYLDRALAMGLWEADIQMPEGAVMGGKFNTNPTPAVFNTGMVLLGWSALVRAINDARIREATTRAAEWLVRMQEPNGNWIRGNSQFAKSETTVYNVKAAWGLCEAGLALGRPEWVEAAMRNGDYCLSRQQANGWFAECCLDDPARPLLHTIAYSMQGLAGIGILTGEDRFLEGARRTADALLQALDSDGFLPGRFDARFAPAASFACLTGSAQTSIIWNWLYRLTGEERYRDAAASVNRYVMARHDIRNADLRLRGGVPGSWPVDGGYGRLRILNWATKFFADALAAAIHPSPPATLRLRA
jgi:uncharacterized protein YyaL (SSP411 family)